MGPFKLPILAISIILVVLYSECDGLSIPEEQNTTREGRIASPNSPIHVFTIGVNQNVLSRYNITARNPRQRLITKVNGKHRTKRFIILKKILCKIFKTAKCANLNKGRPPHGLIGPPFGPPPPLPPPPPGLVLPPEKVPPPPLIARPPVLPVPPPVLPGRPILPGPPVLLGPPGPVIIGQPLLPGPPYLQRQTFPPGAIPVFAGPPFLPGPPLP